MLSDDPLVTYQVACVYALTAKTDAGDAKKGLSTIRKAFQDGYRDLKMLRADSI